MLAGRGLYQCNRCKTRTSTTAGAILRATELPLTLWFVVKHLIVAAKNDISSAELGRYLRIKRPTTWTVRNKIMAVMLRLEGETPLAGWVEMDGADLAGVRSGGKRGRGGAGKTPFMAAVSSSPESRPRKVKLAPVKGFCKRENARGAKHWLGPPEHRLRGTAWAIGAHSMNSATAMGRSVPGLADRRPAWRRSSG